MLRSYCIGAAHMALGWVRSEGIAVDPDGLPLDLTIRSFGILRAQDAAIFSAAGLMCHAGASGGVVRRVATSSTRPVSYQSSRFSSAGGVCLASGGGASVVPARRMCVAHRWTVPRCPSDRGRATPEPRAQVRRGRR